MSNLFEIHTLAWDNCDAKIVEAHQSVVNHFSLPVKYRFENIDHGKWMDECLQNSSAEIVGFLDIDCVPVMRDAVNKAVDYCQKNKSFIGIAQCSNHIYPHSHIFAAPSFFFIHRNTWISMGKPSFRSNKFSDVAENVSYEAESLGLKYKALFPVSWERVPNDGAPWGLSNYGIYGIGTYFNWGVYHLYQSRYSENVDLFVQRCKEIIDGVFNNKEHNPCY